MEQLNTLRLCSVWLKFLDHAGKYTARYYLARDLELPLSEQSPKTRREVAKYYGTEANLLGVIDRDLGIFPEELREIIAAQVACGLQAFPDRDEYLNRIVMGFTIFERHGKERRTYYRRQINKILKKSHDSQAEVLSLNQLEAGFHESRQRAARRKKAA